MSSLVLRFFSVNGVTYLSSDKIYENKSTLAKWNLSLSDELSYFDTVMQKNYAVRLSEVAFDVRGPCAALSHLRAQHETQTVHLLENQQLKQWPHFSGMCNCGCLGR